MQNNLYIPIDTNIYDPVECEKLVKRGDTIILTIKVFTNGVLADLTGQTVDIILSKADGTVIQHTLDTSNISGGVITAQLEQQATVVAGPVNGEFQIYTTSTSKSTNTFTFNVDESVADNVIEISQNDISLLNDVRQTIANGEMEILQYKDHILAIANSIEAIEALENIKSYIETNLPALESNNAQAVINNNNLIIKNVEATENISTLTSKNTQAENDIKNLSNTINIANTTKDNLDNSILTGGTTKSNIDSAIEEGNIVIETIKDMETAYTQHINNSDIHVTKAKKDSWDLAVLNAKEIINILDKTVGMGTLDDENGEPWVDENNEQFIG